MIASITTYNIRTQETHRSSLMAPTQEELINIIAEVYRQSPNMLLQISFTFDLEEPPGTES